MGQKKPRKGVSIQDPSKTPRGGALVAAISSKNFCWRFSDLDWGGPFGWAKVTADEISRTIVPKFHDLETMTWAEIDGPSGSHSVSVDDLCPEAKVRLADLKMGHVETLFSVRITGARRIWGVKDVAILRVLWWDPDHKVCPSIKKNT
jgi:hypothetical protein